METTLLAPRSAADLRAIIYVCGVANLLAFAVLIPVSYGIAVVSPFGLRQEDKIAFLQKVLTPANDIGPFTVNGVRRYLSGDSPFASPAVRAVMCTVLLLVPTVTFLSVAAILRRNVGAVDETVVSLLFRMSIGFCIASVFAYPMFTQDFWLSVVWGRMILSGDNPYYRYFTPEALAGLPLLNFNIRMTYGPLWALVSAGLAFVCGRNAVLEFLCFKLVLAAAWILCLDLVRRILAGSPPGHRAVALCIAGWLPMSVHLSVGEGHNDIVMVALLMLWMLFVARNQDLLSPFALAASALIKYVTAPLAALELLRAWSGRAVPRRAYLAAVLLSVVAAGVVLAPFWQGPGLFAAVVDMRDWEFFTPAHAIASIANWLHLPVSLGLVSNIIRVAFLGAILHYGLRYYRAPTFAGMAELTLAVLCAILFTQVGHVWPWFVLWIVVPAAIAGHSALLRFVIAVAVVTPFMDLYWLLAPGWDKLAYGSVAFYALAAGALLLFPRGGWVILGAADAGRQRP